MLTKNDLDQLGKIVRKIVREEIEVETTDVKNSIKSKITLSKIELKHDINELDDRLKSSEIRLNSIEKDVKDVKKRVILIDGKIDQTQRETIEALSDLINEGYNQHEKRIKKLEEHLLPSQSQ